MSMLHRARREISRHYGRHGRYSGKVDRLNRLPLLRDFVSRFPNTPSFPTREAMWDHLAARGEGAVDYLEFGVFAGRSILHWAGADAAAESRFVGFDTFEGLPETWNHQFPKGHFATAGQVPITDDPRVAFVKGLFQDTLPAFLREFAPSNPRRVVHIDCDLYSSTLFCLTQLDPLLRPGTLVVFDEFGDVLNEFRAFNDYCASYGRHLELVAAHDGYFTAALQVV